VQGWVSRAAEALKASGAEIVITAPAPAKDTVTAYLAGKTIHGKRRLLPLFSLRLTQAPREELLRSIVADLIRLTPSACPHFSGKRA